MNERKAIVRWANALKGCVLVVIGCGVLDQAAAQTPVLNELMASNNLAVFDDFFEADDWVEIYNPGGLVQMAGYHISDDPNNLTKYTFPDTDPGSTFLTPGGHMLVWLDKDSVQGVLHANFKLSADNEGVWLTAPDGVTVLDFIEYPPQQTDISYGRSCDGCDTWEYFNVPTPEATNQQQDLPAATLYINEVLLDNTSNLVDEQFEAEPWLEIFNPNANQVNLAGYTLTTSDGDSYTLPNSDPVATTVPGDGFLLLWMDAEPEEGGHHLGFEPSAQPQTFTLVAPDMTVVDEYAAEVSFANISWGRVSDGAIASDWFDIPTPRVTNTLLIVPAEDVVINECQTSNAGFILDEFNGADDWLEIHNLSNVPVNLAGYYLTDRLNNPTKWRFPLDAGDSTVVAPNGYVVLWADEEGSQGWNHTNFRLNNNGEALVLRSPDGFTIADSVHFGASTPGDSYARLPNGTGPFSWISEPTPGECNDCTEGTTTGPEKLSPWFVGGNPLSAGMAIRLDETAILWDASGKKVSEFAVGTHAFPDVKSGVYVLQNRRGETLRLVVGLD
jgi:hypothetical protein